jgi:hypothetical protein
MGIGQLALNPCFLRMGRSRASKSGKAPTIVFDGSLVRRS